jgi:hypothetical protein
MARARRKPNSAPDEDDGAPIIRRTIPKMCPLCEVSSPDMLTHLHRHAPVKVCQRCEMKEKGWRPDLDAVQYFRTDLSIFYCSNCGRYPQGSIREEVD